METTSRLTKGISTIITRTSSNLWANSANSKFDELFFLIVPESRVWCLCNLSQKEAKQFGQSCLLKSVSLPINSCHAE